MYVSRRLLSDKKYFECSISKNHALEIPSTYSQPSKAKTTETKVAKSLKLEIHVSNADWDNRAAN